MQAQDITVVVFVVCVFLIFGIVLGFASWDETRRMRKIRSALPQTMNPVEREKLHH